MPTQEEIVAAKLRMEKWANTPELKDALDVADRKAREDGETFRRSRRVKPKVANTRMTF